MCYSYTGSLPKAGENMKNKNKSNPCSNTIICVGYSRLPEGMAAKNLYGTMGVGLEIDPCTNRIVKTSSTFITNMCSEFLNDILVGHCLDDGIEQPIAEFERRYFGLGKKAVVSAIRDAFNQYKIYKSSISLSNEFVVR
jgi:hypothetical protein